MTVLGGGFLAARSGVPAMVCCGVAVQLETLLQTVWTTEEGYQVGDFDMCAGKR